MQVYCNGSNEHYIVLACPFGKTNRPLEFCPPVSLLTKSAACRYAEAMNCTGPRLGTHVDDIFGGFKFDSSYEKALHFREYLCSVGRSLTVEFDLKETKTPLPSKDQVILGCRWNSVTQRVRTSESKRAKYLSRIDKHLRSHYASVHDLLKLNGNLNYAAEVAPFGRPFLAPLTNATVGHEAKDIVPLDPIMKMCLRIWMNILTINRGLSIQFVLDKLPRLESEIFVDASTERGIGGCCCSAYFAYPWTGLSMFEVDIIARRELLACLIALACFKRFLFGRLAVMYSDNENAVNWLRKGRSSNMLGTHFLAAWELEKYKLQCKISPK